MGQLRTDAPHKANRAGRARQERRVGACGNLCQDKRAAIGSALALLRLCFGRSLRQSRLSHPLFQSRDVFRSAERRFIELGAEPMPMSPGDFARLIADETEK